MESNLKSSGCPKVGKPKSKPKLKPKKVEAEAIVEESGSIVLEVDDEIKTLKFNDFFLKNCICQLSISLILLNFKLYLYLF